MVYVEATKNSNYPEFRYINIVYIDPDNKRRKFKTGIRVHEDDWDPNLKRVKPSYMDYEMKNIKIESRMTTLIEARKTFYIKNQREPSVSELNRQIKVIADKKRSMSDILDDYLEYCENRGMAATTMRSKQSLAIVLKEIEERKGSFLRFEEITDVFVEEMAYGLTDGSLSPTGRRLRSSTVKNYIHQLGAFMGWARIIKKLHDSRAYEDFGKSSNAYLKIRTAKKVSIDHEEWMAIYNIDASRLPGHKNTIAIKRRAIDAAILSYLLGRRINEIVTMEMSHLVEVDGSRFFTNIAKKVNNEFIVPVNEMAWEIIQKQGYEEGRIFRPSIGDTSFMDLCTGVLKQSVKSLGIDRKVKVTYGSGNQLIEEEKMLSDAISVHCARGDFGNRFLSENLGKDIDVTKMIQSLYGHASISTSEGYIKRHPLIIASKMKGLNF